MVQIASGMAEAEASFSPGDPNSSVDRAAGMMVPEQVGPFREQYKSLTVDLAKHYHRVGLHPGGRGGGHWADRGQWRLLAGNGGAARPATQ